MRSRVQVVSAQQIMTALLEWKGNVRQAAQQLGMRRNSLYERIERMGLDLRAFREAGSRVISFSEANMSGVSGVSGSMPGRSDMSGRNTDQTIDRKRHGAPYRMNERTPILTSVEAGIAEVEGVPIRTVQTRNRSLRVNPANQDRLSDAKRRLCALFNVESDETLLLNQFIEEVLEEWVRSKEALGKGRKKSRAGESDR